MGGYGLWVGIAVLAIIVVSLIIFLVHLRQRKAVEESELVLSKPPAQPVKETEKPEDLTKIDGIGAVGVVHGKARTGVKPRTRAKIKIPAIKAPAVRAAKALKDAVKGAVKTTGKKAK
jgi:nucleoid DNA-binding protein